MATSINSYSVGFGMDASSYIEGAKLSRRETKELVKDIEAARSPSERFSREQDRLSAALDKGAISMGTYNRLLDQKRTSLLGAGTASTTSLASITPYTVGIAAAGVALTATVAAGVSFVHFLREQQNQIDSSIDSAKKLGMTYNELNQLRFGFQEGTGLDSGTVDESIKKMQINIAKAIEGDEKVNGAFSKLGLTAGELLKAGPLDAVMKISDAMKGIDTHAERLKISMDIFGKSGAELAATIGEGSDAMRDSVEFQQRWNSLTDEQLEAVASNNDAWDRIGVAISGSANVVAAEFAPAMEVLAENVLSVAGGFDGLKESLVFLVDYTTFWFGALGDIAELMTAPIDILAQAASLDFVGITKTASDAVNDNHGIDALAALYAKRLELEAESHRKKIDREKELQKLVAKETGETDSKLKSSTDDYMEAWNKHFKDKENDRKEEERHQESMAKKALQEAEKFFQEKAKREEKIRDDMAKGPGAGMEVGSAEAVKFMADQANAAMAGAAVSDVTWTPEQLMAEVQNQIKILIEQEATQKEVLEAIKANGFKRIR